MHKLELELPSTANATGGRPMEKVIVRTGDKVRQEVHLPTEVSQ